MILSIIFALIGLTISYLLFLLILKPLLNVRFYQKQGCEMTFFPILGTIKSCRDSVATMGDCYGHWKQLTKNNPKVQVFGGNFLDQTQIFIVDPVLIKDYYSKQNYYVKAPTLAALWGFLAPEGLSVSEGETWKRHRRAISSAFHFELLKDMIPDIIEISNEFFQDIKTGDMNKVDMALIFETISGEIIGRLFFGENFTNYRIKDKPVIPFLNELNYKLGSQWSTVTFGLFGIRAIKSGIFEIYRSINDDKRELFKFSTALVKKKLEDAKLRSQDSTHPKTLIDILIQQSLKAKEEPFTEEEIVSEFITFVQAGKDSVGAVLSNALYHLHKNPQYKKTVMQEIDQYFKDPSTTTVDNLNKMEFMGAILDETLRISPALPGFAEKIVLEDHKLGNINVKKGTLINIATLANNWNPDYHNDEDRFMPERWLSDCKTKRSVAKDSFVYIPYSFGPRNCIGKHLAVNEMKIMLSLFLKKYEFSLPDNYEPTLVQKMVYSPSETMLFKLSPRS